MHPTTTYHEFLQLRVQGLSFAAIARRLGVSKPTLIAWSKKAKPLLAARLAEEQQRAIDSAAQNLSQELEALTRKHNCLKQELLSRALREVSTANLETLAGEYNQKLQHLNGNVVHGSQPFDAPPQPEDPEPIRT